MTLPAYRHSPTLARGAPLVVVESPYAGGSEWAAAYLRECLAYCVSRGWSPYASHLTLTSALRDDCAREREVGIQLGFAWRRVADFTAVFVDHGISPGMRQGISHADALGCTIVWVAGGRRVQRPESDDGET
jgi:hypothetical protein